VTRRRVELLVLAFGVLFAGAVALSLRARMRSSRSLARRAAPGLPAASIPGQATTVLSGFDYTETVRGKAVFRIRSESTVGFGPAAGLAPDRYALQKVALTLFTEGGAPLDVYADTADYDTRTKAAVLKGNVRWSDEKGALGETETVAFHPENRILEAPKTIHLTQGAFDAEARSGRYDVGKRETQLDGPVRGSGSGEDTGGLSQVAADGAVYRRDQQLIELAGNVSAASRQGDRLACDRLILKTGPDGKLLEWARASGSVRGRIASAAAQSPTRPGGLGSGATTESKGAAPENPAPRDYSGEQGVLFFGPDGQPKSFSLSGHPAAIAEAERHVTAETIDLDLAGGRPIGARAQGNVHFDAPPNRAQSDRAGVTYGPAGEIASLDLAGNVRLWGEGKSGTAEQAIQVPSRGVWLLTAGPATSATVESGGSKVSAQRIEIGEKRRDITAEGAARAVFMPEKGKAATASALGDPQKPTYGKAARIVLDDASRTATLSGAASLWQDASSLAADDVTLNDAERSVVGVGNVRAVMPAPPAPKPDLPATAAGASAGAKAETTVVTARRLVYKEAASSATFEGGVVVTRGAWRASGNAGTAFLDKDRKVEHVELTGGVALSDASAGQTGQADRALHYPPEGRTILEGKPARVTDAEGNRVSGATLTITQRGRRVEVTAPEGGKTETVHRTKRD
jgi:lipopolysaccharide export system protein LptA